MKNLIYALFGISAVLVIALAGVALLLFLNSDPVTNTHEINEDFDRIKILTKTTDVVFLPADGEIAKVICHEQRKAPCTVSVKDNALTVQSNEEKSVFDFLSFTYEPKITVYLPKEQYSSLEIEGSTGDMTIPSGFLFESATIDLSTGDVEFGADVSADLSINQTTGDAHIEAKISGKLTIDQTTGDAEIENSSFLCATITKTTGDVEIKNTACAENLIIDLSTGNVQIEGYESEGLVDITQTTGDTHLTSLSCKALKSEGDTGDIDLNNVIGGESLEINRSTGNVDLTLCTSSRIRIQTTTGNVTGSFAKGMSFAASTTTGKVRVPDTSGDPCEIRTTTGNIKITVENSN